VPDEPGDSLTLDAENWQDELLPTDEAAALGEIDREIIFDALVAYLEKNGSEDLRVERGEAAGDTLGADAPLLLPGTRIHVRAGSSAREALVRLVRGATVYAIVGGAAGLAASFSVDLVIGVFEKTSRLSEEEAEIVRTILALRKAEGRPATAEELARALPESQRGELEKHLTALQERKVVIEKDGGGWRVAF